MAYQFQAAQDTHLQSLADILNYYIVNTTHTFHTATLLAADMGEKVFFGNPIYGTFIIKHDDILAGYCTLMPLKKQEAYRYTAEISIYLNPEFTGKGIGGEALNYLETFARQNDIRILIAGCCAENT